MPVRYEDVTAARVTGCRGEKLTAVSSLVKPDHHARVPVPPCVHSSTLTSIGASPFLGLQFFCIGDSRIRAVRGAPGFSHGCSRRGVCGCGHAGAGFPAAMPC